MVSVAADGLAVDRGRLDPHTRFNGSIERWLFNSFTDHRDVIAADDDGGCVFMATTTRGED